MSEVKWSPDSCLCQLIVDENFSFVNWIQKCQEHKNLNGVGLLNSVHTHNKGFNQTNRSNTEKKQDKSNEKARIRSLGVPIKNI
jgi:hypothetical protein